MLAVHLFWAERDNYAQLRHFVLIQRVVGDVPHQSVPPVVVHSFEPVRDDKKGKAIGSLKLFVIYSRIGYLTSQRRLKAANEAGSSRYLSHFETSLT